MKKGVNNRIWIILGVWKDLGQAFHTLMHTVVSVFISSSNQWSERNSESHNNSSKKKFGFVICMYVRERKRVYILMHAFTKSIYVLGICV